MVPDTVQLMVDVAGLYACAPAFEIIRPAGNAPCSKAHTKRLYQCSCSTSVCSTPDNAVATRSNVSLVASSTALPFLSLSLYFLSQMSADVACKSISRSFFSPPLPDCTNPLPLVLSWAVVVLVVLDLLLLLVVLLAALAISSFLGYSIACYYACYYYYACY